MKSLQEKFKSMLVDFGKRKRPVPQKRKKILYSSIKT